jgi:hypothetical protein
MQAPCLRCKRLVCDASGGRYENSGATGAAAMVAVDVGMAKVACASDSEPWRHDPCMAQPRVTKEASMQKSSPSSVEEARQQRMTSYLSLVALVLAGLLVLALAERYL